MDVVSQVLAPIALAPMALMLLALLWPRLTAAGSPRLWSGFNVMWVAALVCAVLAAFGPGPAPGDARVAGGHAARRSPGRAGAVPGHGDRGVFVPLPAGRSPASRSTWRLWVRCWRLCTCCCWPTTGWC